MASQSINSLEVSAQGSYGASGLCQAWEELWGGLSGAEKGAASISTHASLGPPWLRSKTCRGLRYHMKDWMILAP